MKKIGVILIILATSLGCKQALETDYSAIENGLIPAVLVGDTTVTYSVKERMKKFQVPGVSVAVFTNGEIVWQKSYGETQAGTGDKVTPETRFQAASISKSVTGLGVLKLVEEYKLDLDADINQYLKSWKIKSSFQKEEKVTIRRLLTHTAGTNISGIMGYDKSDSLPGTTDILEGKKATPPVSLDTIPGSRFFYSGGGFVILQQLIEDVSGNSFEVFFEKQVFAPLAMSHSTFNQFPTEYVSSAHGWDGKPHPKGWRVFPSLAAAGLWTTPTDLAKFCLAIEKAFYGKKEAFISKEMAHEMLTPIKKRGLGVALETEKEVPFFYHGGSNPGGFRSFMVDAYKLGTGIVVMSNSEQGHMLQDEILRSFSNFFSIEVKKPLHIQPKNIGKESLMKFVGHYQLQEQLEFPLEISINSKSELILYDPNDGMRNTYRPLNDSTFIEMNSGAKISFSTDPQSGKIKTLDFSGLYIFYKVD